MKGFKLLMVLVSILTATQAYSSDLSKFPPEKVQKLANRIIIGFQGTSIEDAGVQKICADLKEGLVGGVILFNYNIQSPEQVKKLIADLRSAAGRHIWVAVDQEGGKVQRFRADKGFTNYLSPFQVAKTMTPEQAYDTYLAMANELSGLGVDLNFGCVVDLQGASPVIGGLERSFGPDPKQVVTYASAFVRAHREAGVTCCLKHYPGHGLANADSHAGMVDITQTYQQVERDPFRQMIAMGLADMIMTAHLVNKKVDKDVPTSLSPTVLKKWLRQEDKFKGQIITDDLHMGAIGDKYSMDEAVAKAIEAGSDLIIISNNKNAAPNVKDFQYIDNLPELYVRVLNRMKEDAK